MATETKTTTKKEWEAEDPCYGMCFIQSGGENNFVQRKCPRPCKLHPCPTCKRMFPFIYLGRHRGKCLDCDMGWKGPGYCIYCQSERKLPSIGHDRKNGANHSDWDSRLYHKKCWKEMINDERELDEQSSDDEESLVDESQNECLDCQKKAK